MAYARRDSPDEENYLEDMHLTETNTLNCLRLQQLVFESDFEQKRETKQSHCQIRYAQIQERWKNINVQEEAAIQEEAKEE